MPRTSSATRSPARIAVIAVAVIALLAVAAVVWFLGGDAPDEVDITTAVEQVGATPDATSGDATAGDDASAPATSQTATEDASDGTGATTSVGDGTWTVDTSIGEFSVTESTGTFVGVRVDEELSRIGETTAVIRTPDVSGTVTLDGTTLTDASFEADFTTLVSDESRREDAVQRALDTATYPTASFQLTEPVELGSMPTENAPVEVDATGELTVHGVTNTVEVPLQVAIVDDVAVVTGFFEIAFADYGVETPSAPIVVSVEDTGTVELQLFLTPA